MRTLILTFILTFVFGNFMQAEAQTNQQVKVRVNGQKTVTPNKITIKFVSLVEDSRCAEGMNCIWAGNAKIKVRLSTRRGESKIVELNTNMGAKGDVLGGYAINLVSLTPTPKVNVRINRNAYTAVFEVSKLTR